MRTPFAEVEGALAAYDAIELSVPVARHMVERLNMAAAILGLAALLHASALAFEIFVEPLQGQSQGRKHGPSARRGVHSLVSDNPAFVLSIVDGPSAAPVLAPVSPRSRTPAKAGRPAGGARPAPTLADRR